METNIDLVKYYRVIFDSRIDRNMPLRQTGVKKHCRQYTSIFIDCMRKVNTCQNTT